MIVNVAGQDRRFIHTFGANAEFRAADIPLERVQQCRVLYLGGYLLMSKLCQEELVPVFAAARKAGAKTVLDVATPGPAEYLSRLRALLPHVDVFMPNNHEAELITGEKEPVRQAELFRQMGARTAVITLGADGARAGERKWPVYVPESSRCRSWTGAEEAMPLGQATSSACSRTGAPRIAYVWPAPGG